MAELRNLIDTNVLLVASAYPVIENADIPSLSTNDVEKVFNWMATFERSEEFVILSRTIDSEYRNKLDYQDYGFAVIQDKVSKAKCDWLTLNKDFNDDAVLSPALSSVIHDRSDRKWVAASLSAFSMGVNNKIVNATDTDWLSWEQVLASHGVVVEQLLRTWLLSKKEKKAKKKQQRNRTPAFAKSKLSAQTKPSRKKRKSRKKK